MRQTGEPLSSSRSKVAGEDFLGRALVDTDSIIMCQGAE